MLSVKSLNIQLQWYMQYYKIIRQAIYIQRNAEVCLYNHCYCGKAISITYSECEFVALVTEHGNHVHCVILLTVDSPALQHFITVSYK